MAFKNSIVNMGVQRADQFHAHPLNPRLHPQKQRDLVHASLKRFGWVLPVVVNKNTGHVVDGHERIWQALAQGDDTPVPFIEIDVTENKEAELLAVLDRITSEATYDPDNLTALLAQIQTDDAILGALLSEMEESIKVDDQWANTNLGPTPQDYLEGYENASFRRIVLLVTRNDHDEFIALVKELQKHFELDNHTDTIMEATRRYHADLTRNT